MAESLPQWMADLLDRLDDPVHQAEHVLALDAAEMTRTDPWRFYCRLCGQTGKYDDPETRTAEAWQHVRECPWGWRPDAVMASDSHGRLMHVWSYVPYLPTHPEGDDQ